MAFQLLAAQVLNFLLIWAKNAEYSETPSLAPSDNEYKPRNVAKEYVVLFLYKAKGIILKDNEKAFELDFFFSCSTEGMHWQEGWGSWSPWKELYKRIQDEITACGDIIS